MEVCHYAQCNAGGIQAGVLFQVARPAFAHLAAAGIPGAEKQDFNFGSGACSPCRFQVGLSGSGNPQDG
jgi:hypothetical protein